MYERFTDRARKVMQLANQEAMRFNHEYIGTEHVLLGLIKEGSGVAAHVLKNLGMDLRKIRHEVENLIQSGPDVEIKGKLPQTPRAKSVIKYTMEEARKLNHNYVGTEHILLGLLREDEGVAAQVLMNLGLTLEEVREEVLNLVRGAGDESQGERFTDRARKVMQLANQEAQRFNQPFIGSEHILLGLIEEGRGVASNVLKNLGIDAQQVRSEIEKLVQSGPDMVTLGKLLPQSPSAKKVIAHAMEEARKLNHNYVGTEHILLGLLREQEGVAAQVLKNLGLKLDNLREMVLNLLDREPETEDRGPPSRFGDGTQRSEVGERSAARGPLPATRINVAEARSEVGERSAARGAFFWSVAVLVLSLVALAGSLLLSIGLGLKACPLCFYQRSFVMGIFAIQAIGLVVGPARGSFLCLLSLPLAAAGLGVAGFHEYLVLNGTLECPAGLFDLGTAPAQSLAAFVVLSVMTALGAWPRPDHRSPGLGTILAAAGVGLVLAWLSIASAPPLPAAPAAPYDPVKQPLDTCRPPFVPHR